MSTYIFESKRIESILDFIDLETFVIFDIDHTLIETVQVIGSTHWEKHLIRRLVDQGMTYEQACERSCVLWKKIQHLTSVQAVEEGIFRLKHFLKKHEIPTLGLTSRDEEIIELTFRQLKQADLENIFSLEHPCHSLKAAHACYYSRGAVFCGNNPKDVALRAFFSQNSLNPKKIVFIDDQTDHLYELEEMAYQAGIDYVGMQYTASNYERFNEEIAQIQEKHLPQILSNEDALKLMESHRER